MSLTRVEKQGEVAIVWLDQPGEKVNKISGELLEEFQTILDDLERDDGARAAVVISAKKDNFIAGADLEMFLAMTDAAQGTELSRRGNAFLKRLAASSKPIVAAMNGATLGAGCEMVLACHGRIASDGRKTVLALPEVQLGLLPGAGGTQRLPRLVGLQRALDLMLTGKNVYPYPAKKMGLVDLVAPEPALLETARKFALELARDPNSKKKKRKRALPERLLEGNPLGRAIVFGQARKLVRRRTRGNYPAPLKIIDCVETGAKEGMDAGLEAESRSFGELTVSPECRQLINLFFGMNAARKNPHAARARPVERLGVLGAGLMGSGLADVSATNGMQVYLKDVEAERIAAAEKIVWDGLSRKVRRRAISAFERDRILGRIHGVTDYRELRGAEMVIEAVFEDLALKHTVLRETEAVVGERTIFASNTSSLPIGQIAEASRSPEQVVGMHYFSPVQKMPLLEVIVTPKTADWVTATAIDVGVRQGKNVIVVNDGPGFYTTRILAPLLNEAMLVLGDGARIESIDEAMKRFGFPVGPMALMDEVGIDVGAHVTKVLSPMFAARGEAPENKAARLVEAGFAGRKNGRGFYLYEDGKGGKSGRSKKKSGKKINVAIYDHLGGRARKNVDAGEIQDRLSMMMVNEAMLCLEEGILTSPRDGDLGAVLGLGFPPFRGGPFRYVDALGADRALEKLETLERRHGQRFRAASILRSHATGGTRFH